MKDGIFKSTVKGFHGPVTLNMEIKDKQIKTISLDGLKPYTVGESAAKIMAHKIVQANGTDVDVISGASYSSNAIKLAAKKAIKVSEGFLTSEDANNTNLDKFERPVAPKYQAPIKERYFANDVNYDGNYDLIIVGSGVAGLSAAVIAAKAGLKVMIFEKAGMSGGTSKYSEGEVQAAATEPQKKFSKYQNDTVEKHINEMLQAGGNLVNPELVKDYAKDAPNIIKWLSDMGIEWSGVFGHKGLPNEDKNDFADRIHYYKHGGVGGSGIVLTNTLLKNALSLGAQITYDTPVVSLITKSVQDNEVVGVVTDHFGKRGYYHAEKGVLLATSGIDHNLELSKQFSPENYRDLLNHQVHTIKTDTGDGIILGMNIGAAVTGFGGVVDSNHKIPEARNTNPTAPAIFVNGMGRRYVNEELTYGYLTRQNYLQEENYKKPNWAIFDKSIVGMPGSWKDEDALNKDIDRGIVVTANTISKLAKKMNVSSESLENTINRWNENVKTGIDPDFERQKAIKEIKKPYYAYHMVDSNFSAIGGLKVNVNQEVIDIFGQPIKGLYAAGMTTGGTIGTVYFASGLALGTSIHQGRKAAKVIAEKE